MSEVARVYVGFDRREEVAWDACKYSLLKHASVPVDIIRLDDAVLRHIGVYYRQWLENNGQKYDMSDGQPFSTEFAFTRFLVPALSLYEGWALFMDCDMIWRADIKELWDLRDDQYAVMCVKHDHVPRESEKMDNLIQTRYSKKNWSSVMLFNCSHPKNMLLTPDRVNKDNGGLLHQFSWLLPHEIGELPTEWNWLEGSSPKEIEPKICHYTRGGPWFDEWQDVEYGEEWLQLRKEFESDLSEVSGDGGKIHRL